jgi:hypothetical protein
MGMLGMLKDGLVVRAVDLEANLILSFLRPAMTGRSVILESSTCKPS